jgi:lysozyme
MIITIDLIKKHEGLRLRPYECTAGKLTIGYGRNLEDCGITEQEAMLLLQNDIMRVRAEVVKNFDWYDTMPNRIQSVLINMCFNLGISRLKGFRKFLAALEARDWITAAAEMMDSRWARQVGPRAIELRDIVLQD